MLRKGKISVPKTKQKSIVQSLKYYLDMASLEIQNAKILLNCSKIPSY